MIMNFVVEPLVAQAKFFCSLVDHLAPQSFSVRHDNLCMMPLSDIGIWNPINNLLNIFVVDNMLDVDKVVAP
jgi:hypothetical protein